MFAIQKAYLDGSLGKGKWSNNIIAGLVVGVVALPLAMAPLLLLVELHRRRAFIRQSLQVYLYPCLVAPLFRLRALQGHLSFY